MPVYVMRNKRLVRKERARPKHAARSAFAVHSDEIPATKHMGTGAMLTSKAEFRRHTRQSGNIEVGNDPAISRPQRPPEPPSLVPYVEHALAILGAS